jgi:SAM-dependent methyltransferase
MMAPESDMDEENVEFYDSLHTRGYDGALYLPLFGRVVESIRDYGSRALLEVGCGSGFLAEMLLREHSGTYRGFDFSTVAIRNARNRTGRPELFFVVIMIRSRAPRYWSILMAISMPFGSGAMEHGAFARSQTSIMTGTSVSFGGPRKWRLGMASSSTSVR